MLYETLSVNANFWTIDGESHNIFESIQALRPKEREFHSNALYEQDATPEVISELKNNFLRKTRHFQKGEILKLSPKKRPSHFRFLEKTPKNALRIDFLKKVFPTARFIYLYRRPEANVSSIMNGWKSGRFVTYKNLPGWFGRYPWSFLLTEGWRNHSGSPLAELAWFQYKAANDAIRSSLNKISKDKIFCIEYDDFLENRPAYIKALCSFCLS